MKDFRHRISPGRFGRITVLAVCLLLAAGSALGAETEQALPPETLPVLHYLLDMTRSGECPAFDVQRMVPLLDFVQACDPVDTLYHAEGDFGAPSAFHRFEVQVGLQRIIDYTLDDNIPSIFFWPSSLRTANWTRVDGGNAQLERLKEACEVLDQPVAVKGVEHLSITPDQHTGAYYSYDVDKMIILAPYGEGRLLITLYRQQRPSVVGKKGWVLGEDDDWSYLYTEENGLNVKGLRWAKTYMYDSFGITVYWEKNRQASAVTCSVISWVNAGWAGINMVQPHHIKRGLTRVAHAFCDVLENPRLPDPESLSATFSRSRNLTTPTLRAYARDYFSALERRIASSETLSKKLGEAFDPQTLIEGMSRDELYAALALDYLKKLLDRDPVIQAHPF